MIAYKELKIKMVQEYIKTTKSAEEIAIKYGTSVATVNRAIRDLDVKVPANNNKAEDWKMDLTGYYVSNKGRVKDHEGYLVKGFNSLGHLCVKLTINGSKKRVNVKDMMFRTFKRPIESGERVFINKHKADHLNFGLGDLKIK